MIRYMRNYAKSFRGAFLLSIISLWLFSTLISCKEDENTVKVGLLHSLTGTMAISEVSVRDAEMLAIKELNEKGGVLGCKIIPVQEDGKSKSEVFAGKAKKLIKEDKVATIFGCWTSDSRKAVKPVVEEYYSLLWYPIQYEGLEASPNIMYTGASPNQQVVPAIDYCSEVFGKKMYLVGSDYVFPRTANKIIKAQLNYLGGECVGEAYVAMHEANFHDIIEEIRVCKPDIIINTLNGDSNYHFFSQLRHLERSGDKIPVMSFSISESEISVIGADKLADNYVCWNYFESIDSERNRQFVTAYKNEYGENKAIGDPVEAAYNAVYLWAAACEKAASFDVEAVRIAAKGISFDAPEGNVTIEGLNQHLHKTIRIGKINASGQIEELFATETPVRPDPYLSTYAWARGL